MRSFTPERREAFLERVREGASIKLAARLSGVPRSTVYDWLRRGRASSGRPETRAFAEALEVAVAECTHAAYKRLVDHAKAESGGSGSVKASLAILAARDERFSDLALRRELLRIQIERERFELAEAKRKARDERRARALEAARVFLDELAAAPAEAKDRMAAMVTLAAKEPWAAELLRAVRAERWCGRELVEVRGGEPSAGLRGCPAGFIGG